MEKQLISLSSCYGQLNVYIGVNVRTSQILNIPEISADTN
jgi:hypothetical protein